MLANGYDDAGNRISLADDVGLAGAVIGFGFDAANRLIEDDDFTYAYDLNGNLETKTAKVGGAVTSYDWDAENRLTRIDLPGGGFAEYTYDGFGRRIQKDVSGTVTRYVYDGSDILTEFDGTNFLLARYTHGPDIDDPVMLERDLDASGTFEVGERFFYQTDGLGSVTEVTDNTGVAIRTIVYDSYGQIVQDTGGVESPFAFTGREFDSESGLHFYRARTYDPVAGRFLSQDPLSFAADDVNLYRYVFNNPVGLKDPDGREATVFGDPLDGTPSPASPGEIIFAVTMTFAPILIPVAPEIIGVCKIVVDSLIGRGGLFNSNRFLRLGIGRRGGRKSFRMAGDLVKKAGRKSGHIDFLDMGPL